MATMREHEVIAAFSARLPLRPDAERVRHVLGEAFVEYIDELWPARRDEASPDWIRANTDEVLAVIERLYNAAAEADTGGAMEFVNRMSWLPPLLAELDSDAVRLDG